MARAARNTSAIAGTPRNAGNKATKIAPGTSVEVPTLSEMIGIVKECIRSHRGMVDLKTMGELHADLSKTYMKERRKAKPDYEVVGRLRSKLAVAARLKRIVGGRFLLSNL